ncbi:MAG: uracil-DNA glycosylase, partial [Polaromonas sp.]|nr:uracil-DNA glycosylase [Polaromonas sp.]
MTDRDKQLLFSGLVGRVKKCDLCPRMRGSARVLSAGCGPLNAKLMFIGEAPGRLGADASEIPFHGDRSGHNFEALLEQVGLTRYDVFVTNAVLCNPKDDKGNNTTPSSTEIANCAQFLKEQIELLDSPIVVTLGATALKATSLIEAHNLTLRNSVRTAVNWAGRKLIPAYHPGQRAMVHRSFANQLSDYQFISETFRRKINKIKPRASQASTRRAEKVTAAAKLLLQVNGELSYFSLHKLLFLAEVRHLESTS